MQTDQHQTSDAFTGTLQQLLALPPNDQQRLLDVLRIAGGVAHAPAVSADEARSAVKDWLTRIQDLPPWERLQLIEAALVEEPSEAEAEVLTAARSDLLDAHPPVAARRAVVDLVTSHPTAATVGVVGLALALFALGRNIFRVVF